MVLGIVHGAHAADNPYCAENRHSHALLIGNKDYKQTFEVPYAHNDVDAMAEFLVKRLCYRKGNIKVLKSATFNEMRYWLGDRDRPQGQLWKRARKNRSNVFVYYSGHGVPDPNTRKAYLLPVDTHPDNASYGYALSRLNENLKALKRHIGPRRTVTLVLDSCFSGRSAGGALQSHSGAIRPELPDDTDIIRFTASGAGQLAFWNAERKLGLFTSVFLDGVSGEADKVEKGNRDGTITGVELTAYIAEEVAYRARSLLGNEQTPTVPDGARLAWKIALPTAGNLLGGPKFIPKGIPEVIPSVVSVGTGGVTGVYYPAGGAICRLVNKMRKETGIRCAAESTGGSIYNINTIRAGELQFGIAQSDWHYHAYRGTSKFADKGRFAKLRSVFSVHPEPVTIFARDDSGVKNIADLKGKRLNIGPRGSGTRGTWRVLEWVHGWRRSDLKLATSMRPVEAITAACADRIDAFFWLVGHPSGLTQDALAKCGLHLVNAAGPAIDRLVADNSFYRKAVIPAGMYNNSEDIHTFGVGATFVTSADIPDDVVYTVVRAVFENFDQFRKLHPAFAHLKPEEMIRDSLTAPLHPGAVRYYREKGWM